MKQFIYVLLAVLDGLGASAALGYGALFSFVCFGIGSAGFLWLAMQEKSR